MTSVATTRFGGCGMQTATDNTETNEHSCAPLKLFCPHFTDENLEAQKRVRNLPEVIQLYYMNGMDSTQRQSDSRACAFNQDTSECTEFRSLFY